MPTRLKVSNTHSEHLFAYFVAHTLTCLLAFTAAYKASINGSADLVYAMIVEEEKEKDARTNNVIKTEIAA